MTDSNINILIGRNLRLRRIELGLSQEAVAREIGISFQQVQKYEKGSNVININRLMDFAEVLRTDIDYILKQSKTGKSDKHNDSYDNPNITSEREILEMIKVFKQIKSHEIRKKIVDLARTVVEK
ncbi:MAG: helix-turn-helix domain-containing protein [Rickettsiales bacterium]